MITSFSKFYDLNLPCSKINNDTILSYIAFLDSDEVVHVNKTTIRTRIVGLRVILYYAMSKHYMDKFEIKAPRLPKTHKKLYSNSDLGDLMKSPKCDENGQYNFVELRTWTIINHIMEMGLRAKTLRCIKISDIDLVNKEIFLEHLKSGNQITLPFRH